MTKYLPDTVLQPHLDFGEADFSRDAFHESHENAAARAALLQWRTWPGGVFGLHGEAGAGKSHLATIWAHDADAMCIDGTVLSLAQVGELDQGRPVKLLVDRADETDETALFALLTLLERDGGAVLLVAHKPPSAWTYALPDLRSRLNAIACEAVLPPEAPLLAELIIRQAAARGFRLERPAADYLAARIPRTFIAAKQIVLTMETVASTSLKTSMALAQRAIRAFYSQDSAAEDTLESSDLFDQ